MVNLNGGGQRSGALPVLRVVPGGTAEVVLQSKAVAWVDTHWQDRLLWCAGEGCELCRLQRSRPRVYAIATVAKDGRAIPVLLELPAVSWRRCIDEAGLEDSAPLRGCVVRISRSRAKGPLLVEWLPQVGTLLPGLEDPMRIMEACAVLQSYPLPQTGETFETYVERLTPTVRALASRAASRKE